MEIDGRGLFMPMASVSGARSLVENYARPAIRQVQQHARAAKLDLTPSHRHALCVRTCKRCRRCRGRRLEFVTQDAHSFCEYQLGPLKLHHAEPRSTDKEVVHSHSSPSLETTRCRSRLNTSSVPASDFGNVWRTKSLIHLLVIQQLFDRIESRLGIFIALAIAQQLELKPGRRQTLQNAVVQVTSEPNPFSGGRSLFGLALQNLPVELHSDPRRDKLDQQQQEITPAAAVQNEDPPPAEGSHKRCRPDAANLKSSDEFLVNDRGL